MGNDDRPGQWSGYGFNVELSLRETNEGFGAPVIQVAGRVAQGSNVFASAEIQTAKERLVGDAEKSGALANLSQSFEATFWVVQML